MSRQPPTEPHATARTAAGPRAEAHPDPDATAVIPVPATTRTTSLRRRVTLTALAVLGVVLLAAGIAINAVFTAQAERSLNALLAGRVQLAKQLARQNVAPEAIVRRVDAPGLRVSLKLPSGEQVGARRRPRAAICGRRRRCCPARSGSTARGWWSARTRSCCPGRSGPWNGC